MPIGAASPIAGSAALAAAASGVGVVGWGQGGGDEHEPLSTHDIDEGLDGHDGGSADGSPGCSSTLVPFQGDDGSRQRTVPLSHSSHGPSSHGSHGPHGSGGGGSGSESGSGSGLVLGLFPSSTGNLTALQVQTELCLVAAGVAATGAFVAFGI